MHGYLNRCVNLYRKREDSSNNLGRDHRRIRAGYLRFLVFANGLHEKLFLKLQTHPSLQLQLQPSSNQPGSRLTNRRLTRRHLRFQAHLIRSCRSYMTRMPLDQKIQLRA